jgi:hypothetical protein
MERRETKEREAGSTSPRGVCLDELCRTDLTIPAGYDPIGEDEAEIEEPAGLLASGSTPGSQIKEQKAKQENDTAAETGPSGGA